MLACGAWVAGHGPAAIQALCRWRSLDSLRFTSTFAILSLLAIGSLVVFFYASPELDACEGFDVGTVSCHKSAQPVACPGTVTMQLKDPMGALSALSKFVRR